MSMFHKDAPVGDIHIIHQWTYADATAKAAATGFVSSDVGKAAKQTDTAAYYILTATTPTWQLIGDGTAAALTTHANLTAAHGVTGAVVGTTDTQTLTNKTISGASNTITNVSGANVVNTPAGNLAATTVQAALDELQTDVDTRATTTALSNHEADTTSIHGIANTADLVLISAPVVTAPIQFDEETSGTTPAAGKRIFYPKTDGKFYHKGSDGLETAVGSGSGGTKNYITVNADIETNSASGFSLGTATLTNGIPSGAPTFGSGANAALSLAATATLPIAGVYSLNYVSSAATTAGNFVATDALTIDPEAQGKVLQGKISYRATTNPANGNFSGTSANSFGVAVYDVTNSAWIPAAGNFNVVQSSGVGVATFTAQMPIDCVSARVVFYNASASAGAITMTLDNWSFGPQQIVTGAAIGDATPHTITATNTDGFGTPDAATQSARYWRSGDRLIMRGYFKAGTTTAVPGAIYLPAGLTIDAAKISTTANVQQVGTYQRINTGASAAVEEDTLFFDGSTLTKVFITNNTSASNAFVKRNGADVVAASDGVSFEFEVPIVGWSSNSVMSNDTDTRVVAARVSGAVSSAISGTETPMIFPTTAFDTHAGYSATNGRYTVPVSGFYRVTGLTRISYTAAAGIFTQIAIRKNAVNQTAYSQYMTISTANNSGSVSGIVQCVAGDLLDVSTTTNGASPIYDSAGSLSMSIERLSGPATIAASESVNARYYASATTVNGTLATVVWTTKDYDSHSAMASGVFTCPVSGKYQVNSAIALSGTFILNNTTMMEIQKNGTAVSSLTHYAGGAITQDSIDIEDQISCVAGDTLRVQVSSAGTGPAIVSSNTRNWVSISRTGN